MSLNRLFQIVVAEEVSSGVAVASLVASGNVPNYGIADPAASFSPESYTRDVLRGSLTPTSPIQGATGGTISFRVELTGHTDTPDWYLLLQAAGMHATTYNVGTPGTITVAPAFFAGETVDWAGGGTSTVLTDTYNGDTEIFLGDNAGTRTGAITGRSSGAVCTPGTMTADGNGFIPYSREEISIPFGTLNGAFAADSIGVGETSGTVVQFLAAVGASPASARILAGGPLSATETISDPAAPGTNNIDKNGAQNQTNIPSLSMALIEDGRYKQFRGCRGSVSLTGEIGQPMFLNFEFSGAFEAAGSSGPFTVASTAVVPPALRGITFKVGSDDAAYDTRAEEVTPCINSLTVDLGNTASPRKCMDNTAGIIDYHLTARAPTMSIDPEVSAEAFFPFINDMVNGVPFRTNIQWGTITGAKFILDVPAAQVTSESVGDRDGIATSELQAVLSGKLPGGGDGVNREFTLLHRTA